MSATNETKTAKLNLQQAYEDLLQVAEGFKGIAGYVHCGTVSEDMLRFELELTRAVENVHKAQRTFIYSWRANDFKKKTDLDPGGIAIVFSVIGCLCVFLTYLAWLLGRR